MAWKFTGDRAVYLQIAERIKKSVLSGVYPPGGQIPRVRQLAMEAAVNPNTVQHALRNWKIRASFCPGALWGGL